MRRTAIFFLVIALVTGCNNLSPRQELQQELQNQGGKIGQMENMTNSMKAEIGKLQNQAEIQNSKLDRVQQGLANIQNIDENNGVQILSGNGGLILALLGFVLFIFLIMLSIHYRLEYKKYEKAAKILTQRIISNNDPNLEEKVFEAVMYSDVEDKVLNLFKAEKEFDPCHPDATTK